MKKAMSFLTVSAASKIFRRLSLLRALAQIVSKLATTLLQVTAIKCSDTGI